ncbi:MAG: hypothetical protein IPJ79_09535 [Bacteroidetes bacterium]|nr:hypothetical protein [Bacteroidota bacterium]
MLKIDSSYPSKIKVQLTDVTGRVVFENSDLKINAGKT